MPKKTLALKLHIEVDAHTAGELDGQSRICNWLYNHLLEKSQQLKQEFKQSHNTSAAKTLYSKRGLRNLLPSIKQENPFLKVVHSSPLKNTALRLSDAIRAHQKSRKGERKGHMGWPKFRAWKAGWFSLFYDEPHKGFKINGQTLILSMGMGQDRKQRSLSLQLSDAPLLKGKTPRTLRITYELGHYYAFFPRQKAPPAVKPISNVL